MLLLWLHMAPWGVGQAWNAVVRAAVGICVMK